MSKKLLFNFTFDASEKTVVVKDEFISQKELLLITNVTDGRIIYNFSNSNLGATSVTYDANTGDTTIVLVYDTTGMSDNDELQIYYDKASVEFEPVEALVDPVSKIRVSNPNTLVDTDFEYGPQSTKWETIELVENIPLFFTRTDSLITDVSTIEVNDGSNIVTVSTASSHGLAVGFPIDIRATQDNVADGAFVVDTVVGLNTFTYKLSYDAIGDVPNAKEPYTQVYVGEFFSISDLKLFNTSNQITFDPSTAISENIITASNHGFSDNDVVQYTIGGGTQITGIDSRGLYFVEKITDNTLALSTSKDGSRISISAGAGSTHKLSSVIGAFTDAGDPSTIFVKTQTKNPLSTSFPVYMFGTRDGVADDAYNIKNVLNDTTVSVAATSQVEEQTLQVYVAAAGTGIVTAISGAPFYFVDHGFKNGQMVVYEPELNDFGTGAGNTALESNGTGLRAGDVYFVFAKGQNYFSLSESSSDAEAGTVIDLTDAAHGTKEEFHQFKFKHVSGLKQGTGTIGISTVARQSTIEGTGTKFLADVKIGDEIIIYDTSGSFSATTPGDIDNNGRRGTNDAIRENARNATNDYITFGNGNTAGAPNAANGGAWVVGEPFEYIGVNQGNNTNRSRDYIGRRLNQASKYNNDTAGFDGTTQTNAFHYVHTVAANGQQIRISTNPGLNDRVDVTSTTIKSNRSRVRRRVIDARQDLLFIPNHGFSSGDTVSYTVVSDGSAIGGLTKLKDYEVVKYTNSTFGLLHVAGQGTGTAGTEVALVQNDGHSTVDGDHKFTVTGATAGVRYEREITAVASDTVATINAEISAGLATGNTFFIPTRFVPRSEGYAQHRPYDGGMEIATNQPFKGAQMIRQTRKYFRYQSGKGLQISFAVNFKPPSDIDLIGYPRQSVSEAVPGSGTTTLLQLESTVGFGTTGVVKIDSEEFYYTGINSLGLTIAARAQNGTSEAAHTAGTKAFGISSESMGGVGVGSFFRGLVEFKFPHGISSTSDYAMPSIVTIGATVATGDNVYGGGAELPVIEIHDTRTLSVSLGTSEAAQLTASGLVRSYVPSWTGSSLRAGMYDFQNGMFFEYDGGTLYFVRRNSTVKLSGKVTGTKGSNVIGGTETRFTEQLKIGDQVVLRGTTYKIQNVNSDTEIEVTPEFRSESTGGIVPIKTQELRVAQSEWNIDKMDGTGPSGYTLDLSRIQMAYIDYSWYGAGAIRFGFKDLNGKVKYAHRMIHNNSEVIAYFRSGNLPTRYEVENTSSSNYAPRLAHWGVSVIMDGEFEDDQAYLFNKTSRKIFPTGEQDAATTVNTFFGVLDEPLDASETQIDIRTNQSPNFFDSVDNTYTMFVDSEQITFNSISFRNSFSGGGGLLNKRYRLNGSTRGANSTSAATHSDRASIELSNSANIGGSISAFEGIEFPILSVRLAPSVDSGIPGLFGQRDIINRMQMQLQRIDMVASKECSVDLRLNSRLGNSFEDFQSNDLPSISQFLLHNVSGSDVVRGGDKIFGINLDTNRVSSDLTSLAPLGNSIVGGDLTFPEGPDILTVVAKIDVEDWTIGTDYIYCTLNWTESQA